MEVTLETQQVINYLKDLFEFEEFNSAMRVKHEIICFLRNINSIFASEVNNLFSETKEFKNAIEEEIKRNSQH